MGITNSRDQLLGDIDNDGDLDLLTTGGLNGVFSYLNDGTGRFTPHFNVFGGMPPRGTALGDFNQDGFLDLLSGDGGAGFMAVALNDGTGEFGLIGLPTQRLPLPGAVSGVAVGDVDGDGDLDFAAAHPGLSAATIGMNDGNGRFSSMAALSMGPQPSAIQLADIDNDGDLDLLTSNESGNSVTVRLNEGLGNFGLLPAVAVIVGVAPTDLVLADLDADGDLDLLTANRSTGNVSVRFNAGGVYGGGATLALPVGSSPNSLTTGDVDADGDLDLVVAQGTGARVFTYLNNGSGSFTLRPGSLVLGNSNGITAPSSTGVALGDVDADGDLDLITAEATTGQVVLGRNTPQPVVSSFSPASGRPGSVISIGGNFLQYTHRITFSGLVGNVVSTGFTVNAAGTQLLGVVVPPGAVSGPISVSTKGGSGASSTRFVVPTPLLVVQHNGTTYAPEAEPYEFGGQAVNSTSATTSLTLLNAGAEPLLLTSATTTGDFTVVGPVPTTVAAGSTATLLLAFRPTALGLRSGTVALTSNSGGYPVYTLRLRGAGIIPPPAITGFVPASAQLGYPVTLEGINLAGASAVTFAGFNNNVTTTGFTVNSTGTQLTDITIPAGANTGLATVTTPGGTSTGVLFTVLLPQPPTLTSFNPAMAVTGTIVTLTGTNLLGTDQINFAGRYAAFQVVNSTTIRVTVPVDAESGTVILRTPGGYSNSLPFVVLPRLRALQPYAGSTGKSITLHGTGLGGITAAHLNGIQVPLTTYAGGPAFTVPAGASSGLLTVTTAAGTSNGLPFTVTVPVTLASITPRTGAAGTRLTLSGTNLQGATAISFGGVAHNTVVSGFTVSADGTRITGVVVPSGAATGPVMVTTPNGTSAASFVTFTITGPAVANAPAWQGLSIAQGGDCDMQACATDGAGNVYMVGKLSGQAQFGNTTLSNFRSGWVAFLAKWSPASQNFEWARLLDGAGYNYGPLAVSGTSIYVAGRFYSSPATGQLLSVVSKYTTAGTLVWQQGPGANADMEATALAVQGNQIYVAGNFSTANSLPLPMLGTTTLRGSGGKDGFVAKLIDAGSTATFAWALETGGTQDEEVRALAIAGSNLYLGGQLSSRPTRFGSLALQAVLTPANDNTPDGYVAKIVDTGSAASFVWTQPVGGAGSDKVAALAVQGNSVYVAGQYEHAAQLAPLTLGSPTAYGEVHGFVAKLLDAGPTAAFIWAQPIYTQWERGAVQVQALAVSGSTIYVGGGFSEGVQLGTTTLHPGSNGFNCYVARYQDAGNSSSMNWVQIGGGSTYVASGMVSGLALSGSTLYAAGHVYRGGINTTSVRFPPFAIPLSGTGAVAFLTTLPHTPDVLASTAPVQMATVELYPNPAHRQVTVQLPPILSPTPATITVLNALGRHVATHTTRVAASGQRYLINLTGLQAGVYLVRVALGNLSVTKRLLVE